MQSSRPPTTIVLLSAIDAVARQAVSVGLLLDLPDAVVVSHDLVRDDQAGGEVRRIITDATGPIADETNPLDHACLSCTVREDMVPTLEMLLATGRWSTIVLALPLTAATAQVAHVISAAIEDGTLDGARLAAAVSLVELSSLRTDLLGDDLLDERDLAIGDLDRRSVGEALASQIEYADVVITVSPGDPASRELLEHVASPTTQLHYGWDGVAASDLVTVQHDPSRARRRLDPLSAYPSRLEEGRDAWTIDLHSARPFHPRRLMEQLEALGTGEIRSRGHFWLPSRPDRACVWDGSGGQLNIGDLGPWGTDTPRTRLVITGVKPDERHRIEQAFHSVIMTADEMLDLHRWASADDGFDPWLGQEARGH